MKIAQTYSYRSRKGTTRHHLTMNSALLQHDATRTLEVSLALLDDHHDLQDNPITRSCRREPQHDYRHDESSSSLDHEKAMEDISISHLQDDDEQPFPIIKWSDEPSSFRCSLDSSRENPTVTKSSNSGECMHDISCRLHRLSLNHQALHRSMAFMADLSSLDVD
jgi:hypothetical protein